MILSVPETEIYMVLTKILATLLWSRVSVLKGKDHHWCIYEYSQAWLSIQGYWLSQTFLTPSLGLRGNMICSAKKHWRSSLQWHIYMHKPVLTFLEKVKRVYPGDFSWFSRVAFSLNRQLLDGISSTEFQLHLNACLDKGQCRFLDHKASHQMSRP